MRALRRWTHEDELRSDFYRQFVRAGDLVFDVGANVGNRTKVFLNLGARVVAFEPQQAVADILQRGLGAHPRFTLVREALGPSSGEAEMLISEQHVLSTLSRAWVEATGRAGRFESSKWSRRERVVVNTLDAAVKKFGSPAFVKIDVEGFEIEVLSGLTHAVNAGSVEFAAEAIDSTIRCIERVAALGSYRFQLSLGESLTFALPGWVSAPEVQHAIERLVARDKLAWGDVYFRMETDSGSHLAR